MAEKSRSRRNSFWTPVFVLFIFAGFYVWLHDSSQKALNGSSGASSSEETYVSELQRTAASSITVWKAMMDPKIPFWNKGVYATVFLMFLSIPMALIMFGIARVMGDRRMRRKHPEAYEVYRRYS